MVCIGVHGGEKEVEDGGWGFLSVIVACGRWLVIWRWECAGRLH